MADGSGTPKKRTVQSVIDAAVGEGRRWEILCYFLVGLFVLLGTVVLVVGVARESGLVALAGSVFASLFWPALRYADGVRRDLVRTRLYELPLTKAKTAEDLLRILREIANPPAKEKPE